MAIATLTTMAATTVQVKASSEPEGLHVVITAYRPYGFVATSYANVREALHAKARQVLGDGDHVAFTTFGSYAAPIILPNPEGRCKIHRPIVFTFVEVQWPHWRGAHGRVGEVDADKWARREGRIFAHEQTHAEIAEFGGGELLRTLSNLGPIGCGAVISQISSLQREALSATQATQDTFDYRGGHRGALSDIALLWQEVHHSPSAPSLPAVDE